MNVICIDKPLPPHGEDWPGPDVGDLDVVIYSRIDSRYGPVYKLERFGTGWLYSQYHFAVLSDNDGLELVDNKEECYA